VVSEPSVAFVPRKIEQLICSQVNEDNKEKGAGRIEHANAW
jgi:hypothetical protein